MMNMNNPEYTIGDLRKLMVGNQENFHKKF